MTNQPSRHQIRRHALRLRRDGVQPIMFLNSGDRLPASSTVLIGRLLWRYRSELCPFVIAALVVLAASVLHRTHPASWPGLAGVTVAAGASLAAPPPQWARRAWSLLDRTADRAYAVALVTLSGGWLTAAIALGPATAPMPVLAAAFTMACGIPWWASQRRRAKVRLERTLESWPEIAGAVGLAGSQVMSAVVDLWGWRARVRLARGQTINDVIAKVPAIESGLGTFRGAVRVYPTRDDLANRCELRVLNMDPHADAIPWPGPSVTSIMQPIDLGPFEDAAPCRVLLLRRHTLAGGTTGAGKSGGLNVLMGNLVAWGDVVLWGIDLKKGMELRPWAGCLDHPQSVNPDQAVSLLRGAVAVVHARAELLATTGHRVWEPSPEMPALVIVIDEFAELADLPEAARYADSIARLGRAVAVTLIAATQRPTQKAMGHGAVRSQMDVRICFRVRERKDVDLILGQGMLAAGWHAHTLNAPGKFLISAPEHQTPKRARGYLVTDQAVADTVSRYADLRPTLDEVSQCAIEDQSHDAGLPVVSTDGSTDSFGPQPSRTGGGNPDDAADAPESILWAALSLAPDDGATVPELMDMTDMSRPWVYLRLRELTGQGQVVQVGRGRWRAVIGDVP